MKKKNNNNNWCCREPLDLLEIYLHQYDSNCYIISIDIIRVVCLSISRDRPVYKTISDSANLHANPHTIRARILSCSFLHVQTYMCIDETHVR